MRITRYLIGSVILLLSFQTLLSQDAQWKGPDRNAKYPSGNLLKTWPARGPELILKVKGLGGGYSTPLFYEGRYYVTGRRDTLEVITAIEPDGKILWETVYGRPWMESFQETRNTPAIEDGRIYITGAMGTVNCIDAASGEILWSRNTHKEFNGGFHRWGMAESVLLTDNAVISSPVGENTVLVALDKKDGSLLWKTESIGDVRMYASPLLINHRGKDMIIATTSGHLVGIDPENGDIWWKYDIVTDHTGRGRRNSTNTPLYKDGEIFISSGYDDQAIMFSLADDGRSVSVKWTNDVLDNHHGGMVEVNGYIYGANWLSNGNGNWVCLEWSTGKVMYEEHWHNKGSIIWADGMLYLFEEKMGHMGLFEVDPARLVNRGSFVVDAGRGPRWAHPSIYDNKLLLRHLDVLLVYDLKAGE